jgi:hypothetical protein
MSKINIENDGTSIQDTKVKETKEERKARLKVQFAEEVEGVGGVDNEGPPINYAKAQERWGLYASNAMQANSDLVKNLIDTNGAINYLNLASIPLLDSVLALATQQEKEERKKRHEEKKRHEKKRALRLSVGEKLDSLNLNNKSLKRKIIKLKSKIDESKKAIAELNLTDKSLKGKIIELKSEIDKSKKAIADDKKKITSSLNRNKGWTEYVKQVVLRGKVDVVGYDDATLEKFKDDLLAFKNKTIEPDDQKVKEQYQFDEAQGEKDRDREINRETRKILRTILDGWGDLSNVEQNRKIPQGKFRKFIEEQHQLLKFKERLLDVKRMAIEGCDQGIEDQFDTKQRKFDRCREIKKFIIPILDEWGDLSNVEQNRKIPDPKLFSMIETAHHEVKKLGDRKRGEEDEHDVKKDPERGDHKAYEGLLADEKIDILVNEIFKSEQETGQKLHDPGERKVKEAELVEAAIRANVCKNLFEIHTKYLTLGAVSNEEHDIYKKYASVIGYEEFIDKKNKTLSEKLQDSMDYSNKDFREKAADLKANYLEEQDTFLDDVFNLSEKKADTPQELQKNLQELKDIQLKLREKINRENPELNLEEKNGKLEISAYQNKQHDIKAKKSGLIAAKGGGKEAVFKKEYSLSPRGCGERILNALKNIRRDFHKRHKTRKKASVKVKDEAISKAIESVNSALQGTEAITQKELDGINDAANKLRAVLEKHRLFNFGGRPKSFESFRKHIERS